MRRRKLLITGGLAVTAGAIYRKLRRKKRAAEPDPAADLRQKLDESRSVAGEREEFEAAEVPVDQAEPTVDERRKDVHERAESSIEEMRGSDPS